jgi:dGTPase
MTSRLSPRAAGAAAAERSIPELRDPIRNPFQRDRDRIIHTKAFRRLKHKTQVFISPEGDHYRTRLTHTLEVSAIARTVARALALDEDLVEAISMGHDLGHAPFGHAGEAALDEILRERFDRRFLHNEQSARIVEVVERDGGGLNLTRGVVDGIRHHTGATPPTTLEGQIVRLVDRVAYVNHDIEDAIRAGLLHADELPSAEIAVLGDSTGRRLTRLVTDIIDQSRDHGEIRQSDEVGEAFRRLRAFMFERVYLAPPNSDEAERARGVVRALFAFCLEEPHRMPPSFETDLATRVTDFVSGMTDRYALRLYRESFLPHEAPI